jgi:hypothetical protein
MADGLKIGGLFIVTLLKGLSPWAGLLVSITALTISN